MVSGNMYGSSLAVTIAAAFKKIGEYCHVMSFRHTVQSYLSTVSNSFMHHLNKLTRSHLGHRLARATFLELHLRNVRSSSFTSKCQQMNMEIIFLWRVESSVQKWLYSVGLSCFHCCHYFHKFSFHTSAERGELPLLNVKRSNVK